MATTIQLTDTVTTLDLNDQVNFRLRDGNYVPAIARRNTSQIASQSTYEDVVENITVDVLGNTPAAALTNLDKLARMLDQSERWYEGGFVNPITFNFGLDGGAAGVLNAAVVGADGDSPFVMFSDSINKTSTLSEIQDVQITFKRRGLWLRAQDQTVTSSGVNIGDIFQTTIANNHDMYSPVLASLALNAGSSFNAQNTSYLLIAKSTNYISAVEGEGMALTANQFTNVADTTNKARSSNVLQYAPTVTTEKLSAQAPFSLLANPKTVAVFATYKTTGSVDTNYRVKVEFTTGSGDPAFTPYTTLTPTANAAVPMFLGIASAPRGFGSTGFIRLYVTGSQTTGTPQLRIDTIYLLAIVDETSRVIQLPPFSSTSPTLKFDHSLLTLPYPTLTDGANKSIPYIGNVALSQQGNTMAGVLLMTGGSNAGFWRYCQASTVNTSDLNYTRRRAYLTPN